MKNRRNALKEAAALLETAGCSDARLDAEWLLAEVAGLSRLALLLDLDAPLSEQETARFSDYTARRAAGDPLQYVLGRADFMGHAFRSDARALIPRCDTEPLCEAVIERAGALKTPSVLELGAGSGAVSVSVKLACPGACVTAADVSRDALGLCRENAALHGMQIEWVESDWFSALAGRKFDLIFSNPPYIPSHELNALQSEVRREPALALDGGADGLNFYRRTMLELPEHLNAGGSLLFETGDGESEAVLAMLAECFAHTEMRRDLGSLPRVVIGDGYERDAG